MSTYTRKTRGADLEFISERISMLVKDALSDSPERDVDMVRRTLESEPLVRGASARATQLLADVLVRVAVPRARAALLTTAELPAKLLAPAPPFAADYNPKEEHLAYDETAALAFRSAPSPDIAFKDLLSSDQVAERLGVTRPTVHRRLSKSELIGWRSESARTVFPAGQLDEFNRPAPMLAQVIEAFVDPQVAWLWLSRPSDLLRGDIPIERLKAARSSPGQAQAVVDAALAQSLGAFG